MSASFCRILPSLRCPSYIIICLVAFTFHSHGRTACIRINPALGRRGVDLKKCGRLFDELNEDKSNKAAWFELKSIFRYFVVALVKQAKNHGLGCVPPPGVTAAQRGTIALPAITEAALSDLVIKVGGARVLLGSGLVGASHWRTSSH